MSEDEKKDFVKYALQKVHFYIESNFWSKLDNDSLNKWLNNFKTDNEKYCAAKLLDRFVYYSESDILRLLEYGFNELIFKRYASKAEIDSNFTIQNNDIIKLKDDFLSKCAILPLATMNNPSESSFAITRYMTNDLGFSETKILNLNNLNSQYLQSIENLVIIDDFIGTGNQILDFWNYGQVNVDGKPMYVNRLKDNFQNLEIEYLCLVCTEEGYNNFHAENIMAGLRITYCEKLTTKFKVFGSSSIYFEKHEVDLCKETLEKLCAKNNIDFLGYQGFDYAIAFHHSIPDTSLPLFFKQEANWHPLFKNKKTVDNVII
ncbi:hypothetical protein NAT51_18165 [Flavobacterium amniphilum]|uniref:phosphoribosyltransferase-like protein n=1 Tax=Flavobacterium amniphilum TaxID=1834035 RepID=UPI00202A9934|nr:hypothetical protein [Flavobacterium amniphilum]MCL9807458.1 hypothetical protein [Flavobacterium amniphilum]